MKALLLVGLSLVSAGATSLVTARVLPPSPAPQVLSAYTSSSPLPTSTLTPSPQPTSTPTPTRAPSPTRPPVTRTPTPPPPPAASSEQIYNWINQYSAHYGVSADVIRHIAVCESGFNPSAQTRLYAGLFQYSAPTWSAYRRQMGEDPNPALRLSAEAAIKTTAYVLSLGRFHNWPNCYPH